MNFRPELIEVAVERYYEERPIAPTAKDVASRAKAIHALVAISQDAMAQVKEAKTELIANLKLQQIRADCKRD